MKRLIFTVLIVLVISIPFALFLSAPLSAAEPAESTDNTTALAPVTPTPEPVLISAPAPAPSPQVAPVRNNPALIFSFVVLGATVAFALWRALRAARSR